MCTLLDEFEKEGLEKGLKQGILIGKYQSAEKYAKKNRTTIENAMEQLDFSDEEKAGYAAFKSDQET